MARLQPLSYKELDERQARLWGSIVNSPRMEGEEAPASLGGPFDPWLRVPAAGLAAASLGEELRFHSLLPDRLRELAVLTVARQWRADYEFWAHARIARRVGLDEAIIDALRTGAPVPYTHDDERLVHVVSLSLLQSARIAEDVFGEAVQQLGQEEVVELVMLVGFYVMVSMTLNAFEVPLPPGEAVEWEHPG